MDIPSSEIVKVVYALLPGFIAAWVFYALTAHRRLSPFERTVQALIFTGIVHVIVQGCRWALESLGTIYSLGQWTENVSFVTSILWSIVVGLCFSLFANKDWFHKWLRESKCFQSLGGVTRRTSFPSEWFGAFNQEKRYTVLHLVDGRRLFGWPFEWPDHSDVGHFIIMEPEWVLDDNERIPLHRVKTMLVPAKDVEMVEFMKFDPEISASPAEIQDADHRLLKLQPKEKKDAEPGPPE